MLRITIHKDTAATRFALERKLIGDWVSELERCWLQAAAASPPIRVELNDVSFVDEAGQELLARMAANGAELSAADVLTKPWWKRFSSDVGRDSSPTVRDGGISEVSPPSRSGY